MKILIFLITLSFLPIKLHAATVLFIGDSHSVGPFGWQMDENLRNDGHTVATFASCGSIPKWWSTGQKTTCGYFARDILGTKTQATTMPTPYINDLLKDIKPEVVIMEFGGNYVNTPNDLFIINDIQAIVKTIRDAGASCFWVTNPDTRKNRDQIPRVLSLIKTAVGDDCPIFESHKVTKYPQTGGDGIHYWSPLGTPIAKEWANKTHQAFKEYWK